MLSENLRTRRSSAPGYSGDLVICHVKGVGREEKARYPNHTQVSPSASTAGTCGRVPGRFCPRSERGARDEPGAAGRLGTDSASLVEGNACALLWGDRNLDWIKVATKKFF